MSGPMAILMCGVIVGILACFARQKTPRNSVGLWVPVVWIALLGSRPVSAWLGMSGPVGLQGTLEGSPVDAGVFGVLLVIGIAVLLGRQKMMAAYLSVIGPVVIYSLYCLLSVCWAPFVVPAFKRWTKDLGDIVMILIIVTDPHPLVAVRRVFVRLGCILFPLSTVLIRYTTLGRAWNNDGLMFNTGVTTDKNMLGVISFVISLGLLWNARWLLGCHKILKRSRRIVFEVAILLCALVVLAMAHSSTSWACFLLGSVIMIISNSRFVRRRPSRVHFLSLSVVVFGAGALVFGGMGNVAGALGRDATFSGRTIMWKAMIPAVTNPVIGVGFDSFWTSPNAETFHRQLKALSWYRPEEINEAHNGYLEVYLNLGWIGVSLIVTIISSGYWRVCKAFVREPEIASLMLAYIVSGAVYSMTEAGFRTLGANWIFMLLAVVSGAGARAGLFCEEGGNALRLRRGDTRLAVAG